MRVPSLRATGRGCCWAILILVWARLATDAHSSEFLQRFYDPEDGAFDLSTILANGGFIPVPIIITEPAVDKGLGLAGQFLHPPASDGAASGRTIVGGAMTGNGSWGGGILQQGVFGDGDFLYRLGGGIADVTLPIFPFGGSEGFDYEDRMKFGFANVRYQLPDTSFSFGPRFIYRTSDVSLEGKGPLAERITGLLDQFTEEKRYVAIGLSAHQDTRDNQFTPTEGLNAIIRYDAYSKGWGSDKDFGVGAFLFHGFYQFDEDWSAGGKVRFEAVTSGTPFFLAPAVDLRGVQYGRYQGDAALSLEGELRRQVSERWAFVAFGGYGETFVASSNFTMRKAEFGPLAGGSDIVLPANSGSTLDWTWPVVRTARFSTCNSDTLGPKPWIEQTEYLAERRSTQGRAQLAPA